MCELGSCANGAAGEFGWLDPHSPQLASARQILLPFTGTPLSQRALEAAIRLAKVDGATLMPAFLGPFPLARLLEREQFDRVIISAADQSAWNFDPLSATITATTRRPLEGS
jgi:hypothetical protein